jgi:hypothetical protein
VRLGQSVQRNQAFLDFLFHGRVHRDGVPASGKNNLLPLHFHQQPAVRHLEKVLNIGQLIVNMQAKEKKPCHAHQYEAPKKDKKNVTPAKAGVQNDPQNLEYGFRRNDDQ